VGDGRNDIEMFQWAARAVAMGQAEPELLAVATEVTGPVEADGLAEVLEPLAAPADTPADAR
jgi:hydroxymethylpyrimidine pyrophosphatase-like HAD family hydrolase